MDRERYKGRLLQYLHAKVIEAKIGANRCFSPAHNDDNPSCQISEDHFFCHGCGIQGDIYDAIGILEGIPEFKDQYIFAEKMFDGGPAFTPAAAAPKKETKKRESYIPDTDAEAKLEAFLNKNPAKEKAIRQYLKNRALANSSGTIPDYPADILPELVKHFFYWPGIEEARRALDRAVLAATKIVDEDNKTSWFHSGVVAKLGKGYKLFYIREGQSEKRGTYECHTFPMPGTVDPAAAVILVEGEIDAIACSAIGIKNVFSTGGTAALTKPAIEKYLLNVPEIILCFDADNKGRYFTGTDPYLILKDKKTGEEKKETPATIPEKIIKAGYKGKIKIAVLPPVGESGYKDPDAYIVDGKKDVVLKAIAEAKEYTPKEKPDKADPVLSWEAYDTITIKRLKSLLNKIDRADMDTEDIKPFVSACLKACNHDSTRLELTKWGASVEELDNKDDKTSPYFLIEICETYEISKYIRNEIEKALILASEMLKRIKVQPTIVDIDFSKMQKNENALQFIKTKGIHSAALMIADILDGRMIYNESDKRHYFFNGHTWQREPGMPNVVYNFLCAVMRHFLERSNKGNKGVLYDILTKIEGRRFRVEVSQDFSDLPDIFHTF